MATDQSPARRQMDFGHVTEAPGDPATAWQIERMVERYRFAREHARGGDVLEVACGTGIGLPYLRDGARSVVGGDIDAGRLAVAADLGVPLALFDAQALPFRDASFDLVYIAEATYYLPDLDQFIAEAVRVLRPGGRLVVTSVNPAWPGWIPSPHSHRYLSTVQFASSFQRHGLEVSAYAAYADTASDRVLGLARKVASRLHLIPDSLDGRAWLKRLVYGTLQPLPTDLTTVPVEPPSPTPLAAGDPASRYAIIHIVGSRPGAPSP
ncbi:MAG: class I SAM-dependent methyltransferase [Chloroflexi bacterium]|nr:class I SAM-dependent methyltransferase [Chloroflexota bacterium]